jgi:hypothetical protein
MRLQITSHSCRKLELRLNNLLMKLRTGRLSVLCSSPLKNLVREVFVPGRPFLQVPKLRMDPYTRRI